MGVAATLPELSEWTLHALKNPSPYRVILASVSFWPLLIIESVETRAFHALLCPNTCFSRTTCSLSRYNVKIELDCFNCKTGVFSDYSLQCSQNKTITIQVLQKNRLVYGEYSTIIKKKCFQRTYCCID